MMCYHFVIIRVQFAEVTVLFKLGLLNRLYGANAITFKNIVAIVFYFKTKYMHMNNNVFLYIF